MTCAEIREMLAAYSLDALDEQERDAVTGHLERCPPCGFELPDYEKVAAGLGLAVEQHDPPLDLEGRILAAARRQEATARPGWIGGRLRLPRVQPAGLVAALALVVGLTVALRAAGLQMELSEQRTAIATLRERASRYDRVVAVLQAP
ncbi:MAG: zf-HC2 domain-containing protein, partial [Chloroflexi bacterium]|nr:zf-HC2 domain-containing protein [Chloroflexota bacterium]